MAKSTCPWWLGYLLITPFRRLFQNPAKIISPYIHAGMTVLEVGPGMGFFTLDIAAKVGKSGKVIAVAMSSPKCLISLSKEPLMQNYPNKLKPGWRNRPLWDSRIWLAGLTLFLPSRLFMNYPT